MLKMQSFQHKQASVHLCQRHQQPVGVVKFYTALNDKWGFGLLKGGL